MKRWVGFTVLLSIVLVVTAAGVLSGCRHVLPVAAEPACQRIVSLSPSITEIVYALALQEQLVGVTKFCKIPPEAAKKPAVGGYLDVDMEAIIRLKPDLVLLRTEHHIARDYLKNFDITLLPVEHRTVSGVIESIQMIGRTCGRNQKADRLVESIHQQIKAVTDLTQGVSYRPKVLVTVDRDLRYDSIRQVYIAGQDGVYNWMIEKAGGQNAFTGESLSGFLPVSSEGILRMNPDIIIELLPSMHQSGRTEEDAVEDWQKLSDVSAVKNGKIFIFSGDNTSILGPQIAGILEKFARVIHPELAWETMGQDDG